MKRVRTLTVKMEMNCRSDRCLSPGSAPTWRITVDIRYLGVAVGYNWRPNTAATRAKTPNHIITNFIRSVVNTCEKSMRRTPNGSETVRYCGFLYNCMFATGCGRTTRVTQGPLFNTAIDESG